MLMEPAFASQAAGNRTRKQVREFYCHVEKEESTPHRRTQMITDLDFEFHLLVAVASGNSVYPLLLNSFRPVYTNLSGQFFKDPSVSATVHSYHRKLAKAIESGEAKKATAVMKELLLHGEKYLHKTIAREIRPLSGIPLKGG